LSLVKRLSEYLASQIDEKVASRPQWVRALEVTCCGTVASVESYVARRPGAEAHAGPGSEAALSADVVRRVIEVGIASRSRIMGEQMSVYISRRPPVDFSVKNGEGDDMLPDIFGVSKGYTALIGELKAWELKTIAAAIRAVEAGRTQGHEYLVALARQHREAFGPYMVLLIVAGGALVAQIVSFDPVTETLILGDPVSIVAGRLAGACERAGGFFAKVAKACTSRVEFMHAMLPPSEMEKARLQPEVEGGIRPDLIRQSITCAGEVVKKTAKFESVEHAEAFCELVAKLQWDRPVDVAPSLPRFIDQMEVQVKGEFVFGVVRMLLAGCAEHPPPQALRGEILWVATALRDLHALGWSYEDMRQRNIVLGVFVSTLVDLDGGRHLRDVSCEEAEFRKRRDYREMVEHLAVPYIRDFMVGGPLVGATDLAGVILSLNTRPLAELEGKWLASALAGLRPSICEMLELRVVVLEWVTSAKIIEKLESLRSGKVLVVVGSKHMKDVVGQSASDDVKVVTRLGERVVVTDESLDAIVIATRLSYPQFIHTVGRLIHRELVVVRKRICTIILTRGEAEQARYLQREFHAMGIPLPADLAVMVKQHPIPRTDDG
jgi:hypothetical protein